VAFRLVIVMDVLLDIIIVLIIGFITFASCGKDGI